jgi:hypothetical protein
LPVAAIIVVAGTVIARALFAGTLFTRPVFTRPVFAGAIITGTLLTRAVIARPVIAGALVAVPIPATVIAAPIITGTIIAGTIIAGTVITAAVVTGARITALVVTLIALLAVTGVDRVVAAIFTVAHIIVKAILAPAIVRLPLAIIAQHPEIMFGILQIIFCGHPIAGLLRIASQGAVFFQQLGGVAALAVVQPVAVIAATGHLLRARAIVAATAPPPLVVPDQVPDPQFLAII